MYIDSEGNDEDPKDVKIQHLEDNLRIANSIIDEFKADLPDLEKVKNLVEDIIKLGSGNVTGEDGMEMLELTEQIKTIIDHIPQVEKMVEIDIRKSKSLQKKVNK